MRFKIDWARLILERNLLFFLALLSTSLQKHPFLLARKRSHKSNGIGVRRIRTFPFRILSTPLTTPSLTFDGFLVKTRLSESEAEAEG